MASRTSPDIERQIIERVRKGDTYIDIATDYGMTKGTISKIVARNNTARPRRQSNPTRPPAQPTQPEQSTAQSTPIAQPTPPTPASAPVNLTQHSTPAIDDPEIQTNIFYKVHKARHMKALADRAEIAQQREQLEYETRAGSLVQHKPILSMLRHALTTGLRTAQDGMRREVATLGFSTRSTNRIHDAMTHYWRDNIIAIMNSIAIEIQEQAKEDGSVHSRPTSDSDAV